MRDGDDGGDRCAVLGPEAVDQQVLEIAEGDPPIDCPSRGEGDHERVGTAGGAFSSLGSILDRCDPVPQVRDFLIFLLCGGCACG